MPPRSQFHLVMFLLLSAVVIALLAWSCRTPPLRIDGSTPESFERTQREMLIASSPLLGTDYSAELMIAFMPSFTETEEAYRQRFHGKTARQILKESRGLPMLPAPTPTPTPTP